MSRDTNLKCRGYQRGWSKLIRWLELRNSCSINSDDYVVVDFHWLQAGHPTRFRASGFPEAKNPYWISTVSCALQDYVALLFSSVCVCLWLFRNKNKRYFSHWPVIYIYIYTTHSVRNITLTILTNVPHLPCPVFTIYFFYVPMSYFLIILFILCISKPGLFMFASFVVSQWRYFIVLFTVITGSLINHLTIISTNVRSTWKWPVVG